MSLSVAIQHDFGGFSLDARFEAPPGVTVLFGPSGAGKSSLVHAVAGLLRPQIARIVVDDVTLVDTEARIFVPAHRRRMGCVFQSDRLFPHLDVRQNLLYGHWFSGGRSAMRELDPVVELLGIGDLLERRIGALSGGEKQRVAIGRALLSKPRMILADEPLAALDVGRKAEILPYLERLRDEVEIPILYVSHSVSEVARLATTVVAVDQGRVTASGPPEVLLADPDLVPAGEGGASAVLSAQVVTRHDDGLTELSAGGVPLYLADLKKGTSGLVRLRVAASDVILSREAPGGLSALNILPGEVMRIEAGGPAGALVRVRTPAGVLLARITHRSIAALDLIEGATCHAIVKSFAIEAGDVGPG